MIFVPYNNFWTTAGTVFRLQVFLHLFAYTLIPVNDTCASQYFLDLSDPRREGPPVSGSWQHLDCNGRFDIVYTLPPMIFVLYNTLWTTAVKVSRFQVFFRGSVYILIPIRIYTMCLTILFGPFGPPQGRSSGFRFSFVRSFVRGAIFSKSSWPIFDFLISDF